MKQFYMVLHTIHSRRADGAPDDETLSYVIELYDECDSVEEAIIKHDTLAAKYSADRGDDTCLGADSCTCVPVLICMDDSKYIEMKLTDEDIYRLCIEEE